MTRLAFLANGCGLVTAAYWVGRFALPWGWMILIGSAVCALVSLALQLDYVMLVSAPEDLATWTIKHLIMHIATSAEEVAAITDRQLYVEGTHAYYPVRGAFLAQIGGKPSIVITPGQQEDK